MTAHAERSLSFRIAGRHFALPLRQMVEIQPLPPLTHVPKAPPYIVGVFNLVGRIVPVIDVAMKLDLGEMSIDDTNCIIVADVPLAGESAVAGILVDAVGDVVDNDAFERLDLDALLEER